MKRISFAASLYRAAMTALLEAGREVTGAGTFDFVAKTVTTGKLIKYFEPNLGRHARP